MFIKSSMSNIVTMVSISLIAIVTMVTLTNIVDRVTTLNLVTFNVFMISVVWDRCHHADASFEQKHLFMVLLRQQVAVGPCLQPLTGQACPEASQPRG